MMTRRLRCAALVLGFGLIYGPAPVSAGENPRGLPACPNPLTDFANCHIADLSHPALESTTIVGGPRVTENVVPASTNPIRLCWLGHYGDRVGPAVADESFQIRIFNEAFGLPDLQEGPIFTWVFHQGGVPGVDRLEMSCLDGQPCPGVGDPAEGGIMAYSVEFSGGFPMIRNRCYWIEIANIGSAGADVAWSWSGSTYGVDNRTLQNIDGVYGVCGRRSHDRAICISGGVDPFLGTCSPGLTPPPICQLNVANGQRQIDYCDPSIPRVSSRSSSPGSVGGATWFPALRADNFRFAQDRAVSGLCFFGHWFCPSGETFCFPPESVATWDIVYYADGGGVPGAAIASFRVGTTPGVTYLWDGNGTVSVEHPPVNFQAGACYWLSVGRVQSGEGADHQWAWEHTTAGDVGDGAFATNVNGRWHRTRLAGDAAVVSDLAFLLSAGPLTSAGCEPRDCDGNGALDADDIAANPTLDCYNPAGPPSAMGGPDGALDTCQCVADWTRDSAVNSGDISGFLTSWLGAVNATSTDADFDCSGATSSSDISAFLTAWLASLIDPAARGCP